MLTRSINTVYIETTFYHHGRGKKVLQGKEGIAKLKIQTNTPSLGLIG
jgi:hypothetical protein